MIECKTLKITTIPNDICTKLLQTNLCIMYQNAPYYFVLSLKNKEGTIQEQIEEEEIIGRKHEGRKIPRQIRRL